MTDLTKALENATSDHVKATIDLQTLQKQCESLEDKLLHQEELNSALQGQVNDGLHQNEMLSKELERCREELSKAQKGLTDFESSIAASSGEVTT